MVWYCIVLYCIVLYYIILYYIILYYIILYYIILYYIILYYIILYPLSSRGPSHHDTASAMTINLSLTKDLRVARAPFTVRRSETLDNLRQRSVAVSSRQLSLGYERRESVYTQRWAAVMNQAVANGATWIG